ncbi:hypothetical protein MLD38_023442 [Melastoma candidum]|uniref:Uncharacterized protein n=1 Tax=Melastoma candidum TaxID=119954 RepID=A0ACB9NQU1_9MYRT|nr:hypothetical protein MLD38_023442 [Melastoma candidum]
MDQFRQIGEVLGSLKSLMVFRDNILVNQSQCCLLFDMLTRAYDTLSGEMRLQLRYDEKNTKWKILEQPLKELHRLFKEAEAYVKTSLDCKDWSAKAILLYQNTDCVHFHIHNLLCCIPVVIEAIEIAGEISGSDSDDMQKRRILYSNKYQKEWKDPRLFQWKFGMQYLVNEEIGNRMDEVRKEDRWALLRKVRGRGIQGATKYEHLIIDLLARDLDIGDHHSDAKLLPSSVLVGSKDYQVKRRLDNGQFKEIHWLGENFVLRHIFGISDSLISEINTLHPLCHPNILHLLCSFADIERKECFLVTELMGRDLGSYIKEICGPKKRIPFSLAVAVDLMLQIARGMEYLHSKKICHGNLDPSHVLVKARGSSTEGYLHAKVTGFGLTSCGNTSHKVSSPRNGALQFIWSSPEVLAEQEEMLSSKNNMKYTEKSDVYSFGMICFELLTGKVPFDDTHLQGDKMPRNIRAGERPLFPFHTLKYLTSLTKRCWHGDPNQRPSFLSICRILRYVKRFLLMNPDHSSQSDQPMPVTDYCDIEQRLLREFPSWDNPNSSQVTEIPFQMFAYRVVEREKPRECLRESSESGSEGASVCEDESAPVIDDPLPSPTEKKQISLEHSLKNLVILKKSSEVNVKLSKQPGTPRSKSVRPLQGTPTRRNMRMNSETQLLAMSPRVKGSSPGHVSDSELP